MDRIRIDAHGTLATLFINRIFAVMPVMLNDKSTIMDFIEIPITDNALRVACNRIYEIYGVGCTPKDRIVDLLDRISSLSNTVGYTIQ